MESPIIDTAYGARYPGSVAVTVHFTKAQTSRTALLVGLEPASQSRLGSWLQQQGWLVQCHDDLEESIHALAGRRVRLALVDLRLLAEAASAAAFYRFRHAADQAAVLGLAEPNEAQASIFAFRAGADDCLVKPVTRETFTETLARVAGAEDCGLGLSGDPEESPFHGIIGESQAIRDVKQQVRRVADTDVSVFLQGESGVGKELFARALHRASARRNGPFVAVNCGAIAESLQDSELFGHERGAFTGANTTHQGVFERAQSGTVLLDEVAELIPSTQVRLLRVLQDRELTRLGGQHRITLDLRVVSATNADLERAVRQGSFRQDLYYRLVVYPIRIPALRERTDDIPKLVRHFLHQVPGASIRLSDDAESLLVAYPWPGNVRELENVVKRAAVNAGGGPIDRECLPPMIRTPSAATPPPGPPVAIPEPDFSAALSMEGEPPRPMRHQEKEVIAAALLWTHGRVALAARRLGIGRTTLYRKMKEHALDPQEFREETERAPPAFLRKSD